MRNILSEIPEREKKPRKQGITMMMDKGLSIRQAEDFLETNSEYTDIIKLGFGTSFITPNVVEKIKIYQENDIIVYAGGTLFEAFAARDQIDDYKTYLNRLNIKMVEVSDGSLVMEHSKKCKHIHDLSKDFKIISEVGSKASHVKVNSQDWIKWMRDELQAGSWKIIAEAREGGNVGICENNGQIKSELIDEIIKSIPVSDIIWETPNKIQQVWFINKFGQDVNLGNISYDDIIPLECLRLGLRSDTFFNFIK